MDGLRQDLRFALRLFWKDRAFALTTILTLAICIGANAAIFTVVRSVLLRPLPYPESDRLMFLFDGFPGAGVERAGTSVPNYFDRLALTDVLESQALYQFGGFRVGEGAGAEGVSALRVTPSFFRVLRTDAVRGRLFTDEEGTTGHNRVVLLTYAFAQRQPGGLDGIVGRELRMDNERYTVVGVLPEAFKFLNPDLRVFVPLAFTDAERGEDRRWSQNHEEMGRLAAGATPAQAQARIEALNANVVERAGPLKSALVNAGYHTRVVSFEADLVRSVRGALQMLWGGVICLLLIAGVNITNLSLARASGRLKELATRHALGAARGRVIRQLVTETTILTVLGGLLGLGLGYWSLGALTALGLADIPRAHEIRMDATVVAFILGLAFALGVVVGLVPAMHVAGVNLSIILREDSRTGTAGRAARAVRGALVVAQVALAFVLLIGAGLLLASFRHLLGVDPGFTAEHVLTGRVAPLPARYPDEAALRSYTSRALERIRALPGVEAAGATSFLPFSWDGNSSVIIAEGYVPSPGESVVSPSQLYVTPGYLEALRVHLKEGRFFAEGDTAGAPGVVIIDERLAQRFWPNASPIGRRMYLPDSADDVVKPGPKVTWLQVVGVVATVKLKGLERRRERARRGLLSGLRAGSRARNRACDSLHGEHERWALDQGGRRTRAGRPRPGGAALRHLRHVGACRTIARLPASADASARRVRRRGIVARVPGDLRRAGVPSKPADARDRHPDGARQRCSRHPPPCTARGRRAGVRGARLRHGRRGGAQGRHRLAALRRRRARRASDYRCDDPAGGRCLVLLLRSSAARLPRRSHRGAAGLEPGLHGHQGSGIGLKHLHKRRSHPCNP